jgi:hypothetical protein
VGFVDSLSIGMGEAIITTNSCPLRGITAVITAAMPVVAPSRPVRTTNRAVLH